MEKLFGSHIKTYKIDTTGEQQVAAKPAFQFRTAESFLNGINHKKQQVTENNYEAGQRVYHKKFGEGVINRIEAEGDDYKVDIQFDKVGNKRLMAKFAGLQILS